MYANILNPSRSSFIWSLDRHNYQALSWSFDTSTQTSHTKTHTNIAHINRQKNTNISNINRHQQQIDLIEPNACTMITVNGGVPHATNNTKNKRQRQRRRQKQMRQGALVCCATHKMTLKPTSQHAHTKSPIHSSLHQVRAPCVDIQLMTHKMARKTTMEIVVPKTLP